MRMKSWLLGSLLAGLAAFPAAAEYPEKPIEMIVAFAPGDGTDIAARSIALFMEKHLGGGAKIAVINKPGAGGEIGWTTLARATPDGYTIGMINPPAFNALVADRERHFADLEAFETPELLGDERTDAETATDEASDAT